MNDFFFFFIFIILIIVFYRCWFTELCIKKMVESINNKRRSFLKINNSILCSKYIKELSISTNQLIDKSLLDYTKADDLYNQIRLTLGAIKEAIFILNDKRVIDYANESASRKFENGKTLVGRRLESVLRSPSLLEFLENFSKGENSQVQAFAIEIRKESFWFEVSCSKVIKDEGKEALLLVFHDITRLKKLEMMRKEFIANVSHELRTPITIIKGFSEALEDDYEELSDEDKERFFIKINNNIKRLHVLIEDLFKLSLLESQQDLMNFSVQSFKKLILDVTDNYIKRIDNIDQSISINFSNDIQPFLFDEIRMHQVFDNLLQNIFRYAPEFSMLSISVSLTKQKDYVESIIADDGPGIPEHCLPNLFERFYTVDKGRSREKGGTGLGLSIVRQIINNHGGNIYAESKVNVGTKFIFSLPYKREIDE